jgi:mono/diheme cytochrome c family protein
MRLVMFGGLFIIILLLLIGSLTGYFDRAAKQADQGPSDFDNFQAEQQEILHSYGWVDEANGTVRIPVERAMELIVSEGLPESGPTSTEPATPEEVFIGQGCQACHLDDGSGAGPSLVGIFGQSEELDSGESVTVDEEYIRTSILAPNDQIVAGYGPVMPPYEGRIGEDEILALIEYIKSLAE